MQPEGAIMIWRRVCYFVIFILVFTGLLRLGFWQHDRYQQKKQWLAALAKTKKQPYLTVTDLQAGRWSAFRRVKLQGKWQVKQTFLISGVLRHGRTGYSVVTPLQWAPSQAWVLVDRGWVPATRGAKAPKTYPPLRLQWVRGKIYRPAGKRFTLGPWRLPAKTNAIVVQDWDFIKLAAVLKHPVMPFVLRLSPTLPGRYERKWAWAAGIPPARHLGYMLQWWGLALVWLIGAILLMCKNKKKDKE